MVGIFARLGGVRGAHRRTKSAAEVGETLAPPSAVSESTQVPNVVVPSHGILVGLEFKPVEHPVEPLNRDQPVKCPTPEPSILNDGRIWKERLSSAGTRVRADLPVVREGGPFHSDANGPRPKPSVPRRAILPSISAPEHNIIALLDEYDIPSIENFHSTG